MAKSRNGKNHKQRVKRRKQQIKEFINRHKNTIQKQIAEHQKKLEEENNLKDVLRNKYNNEEE